MRFRFRNADPEGPRRRPAALAADKGYSFRRIRRWLHRHKIEPVIPERSNQTGRIAGHRKLDKAKDKHRNVVERCVSWLKECRRVATRYEKLAVNFLRLIDLAIVERLLRVAVSQRTLPFHLKACCAQVNTAKGAKGALCTS